MFHFCVVTSLLAGGGVYFYLSGRADEQAWGESKIREREGEGKREKDRLPKRYPFLSRSRPLADEAFWLAYLLSAVQWLTDSDSNCNIRRKILHFTTEYSVASGIVYDAVKFVVFPIMKKAKRFKFLELISHMAFQKHNLLAFQKYNFIVLSMHN